MFNYIKINLQLFSEKTEEATPKKKEDTRKKGNILQSRELTGAASLFAAVFAINTFSKEILETIVDAWNYYTGMLNSFELTNQMQAYKLFTTLLIFCVKAMLFIIVPVVIVAFLVQKAQVGNIFTAETIRPKLERISILSGFKRMFSMQSTVTLVKSLLKIMLVGYVGYAYIKDNMSLVMKSFSLNDKQFSYMLFHFSINMALRMAYVIIALGIFDYVYQRYSYNKNIRMSKQEIKDEYKQSEGDPQIKSKIKERQMQSAMRRMMQDLPKADVIITNPTHFAVAIKYDESKYDAPYVVAKGQDFIAKKIREKAKELDIPIVENKALARALYSEIDIGSVITPQLYEAVAEVLAYIFSLKTDNKTDRR